MAGTKREEATATQRWEGGRRRLIAVWDEGSTLRPLPDEGRLVIGRGPECDVRIDHPSVSRAHAALRVGPDDALTVEDLGSSNGTRLRGQALRPGVVVTMTADDIVEVGAARVLVDGPDGARRGPAARPLDEPMAHVRRLTALVAQSDISVVLLGETGAGKEMTAEQIHGASPRAAKSMLRLNCAAFSDTLMDSELFGHERGAFTGAVSAKMGLLEAASGGTVFLDEVAELPLTSQAKLLRALEAREVLRVGGLKPRAFDVRFISATNRDLRTLCDEGSFRADLFFRLNGITITIPPLRHRVNEIGPIAEELARRLSARSKRSPPRLTPEGLAALERHPWPGNVRELRNVLERALMLCSGPSIGPEHLLLDAPPEPPAPPATASPTWASPEAAGESRVLPLRDGIDALERERVAQALRECAGNQTKAARLLGISRRTLLTRLDTWGLPRPRK